MWSFLHCMSKYISLIYIIQLFFLVTFFNIQLTAQQLPGLRAPLPGDENELLAKLAKSTRGIAKTEALLDLSSYYLFLPGEEKGDMHAAMSYAKQAKEESRRSDFSDGYIEAV